MVSAESTAIKPIMAEPKMAISRYTEVLVGVFMGLLIKWKSGEQPVGECIEHDAEHAEAKPCKHFEIFFDQVVTQVAESLPVNFL